MEQCSLEKIVFVSDHASKFSACCYANPITEQSALYTVNAEECIHIYSPNVCEQMLSNHIIEKNRELNK